jgi:hypothetical protein
LILGKKTFGGNRGLIGPSGQFYGISGYKPTIEICIFGYFRAHLGTFVFKMRFLPKIVQKTLKMVF